MRLLYIVALAAIALLPLLTSCTALGPGKAVKAGFELQEEEGWASRYIPGVRAISKFVPPPTEARLEWDKRMKRQTDPVDSEFQSGF